MEKKKNRIKQEELGVRILLCGGRDDSRSVCAFAPSFLDEIRIFAIDFSHAQAYNSLCKLTLETWSLT